MTLPVEINPHLLGSSAGYQIERSLRFNSADSANLTRTFGSAPTNDDKATISLWVKRTNPGAENQLYSARASGANAYTSLRFDSTDELDFLMVNSSSTVIARLVTTAKYRDPSAWYHIVFAYDSTDATSSNRLKLYVNGVQVTVFNTATYPAQNTDLALWAKNTVVNYIGREGDGYSNYLNGYLTELNFIDGQALTPSSFGETDSNTGVWKPKAFSGTYGTNGFYLKFADNSGTTSTTLGKDSSGNGNNWTPNNFSVTAGAGNDSLVDTPTSYGTDTGVGGTVRGNYCTINPLDKPSTYAGVGTPINGNLDFSVTNDTAAGATIAVSSGKWYWEMTVVSGHTAGANTVWAAIASSNPSAVNKLPYQSGSGGRAYATTGLKFNENTSSNYGNTYTNGDIIGCALDLDNGKVYWSKNGTFQASGDPVAGTNAAFTGLTGTWLPVASSNQPLTTFNFGQRAFAYTAPSGFKALCTQNLPTPTIGATSTTQASDYFNAVLYTGNGTAISNNTVGFQPDWTWIKGRSGATNHQHFDSIRGVTNVLVSNSTEAETTSANTLTSFDSSGFTVGSNTALNTSAATYVAWNWKASSSNVTNNDGNITSTVRASTTSGFSIVTYTGTGANTTVGHGLGVAPSMVIVKNRTSGTTDVWCVYHSSLGATQVIILNRTDATTTASTGWNNTAPTSSVFSIGTLADVNRSTNTYVAYCFAPVAGYSAFGSFTGNGSADGPFVFTNFRVRWLMIKRYDASGDPWWLIDATRSPYNQTTLALRPSASNAEDNGGNANFDFLSNGFKARTSGGQNGNESGATYIYAAFAENSFKYSLAR